MWQIHNELCSNLLRMCHMHYCTICFREISCQLSKQFLLIGPGLEEIPLCYLKARLLTTSYRIIPFPTTDKV